MLFHHVACGRTRRDELRLHHCCQWHHKFFDGQIHSVFPVSILFHKRSNGIEYDVDAPGLLHDALDVCVDGSVIEGVYHRRVRTAAGGRDLLRYIFHVRLGPAGQKDFRIFGRELLGDGGANRPSCAEHDGVLFLQDWQATHGVLHRPVTLFFIEFLLLVLPLQDVRVAVRRTFFFRGSNGRGDAQSRSRFQFTWTPRCLSMRQTKNLNYLAPSSGASRGSKQWWSIRPGIGYRSGIIAKIAKLSLLPTRETQIARIETAGP